MSAPASRPPVRPVDVATVAIERGWAVSLTADRYAVSVGVGNVRALYRRSGRLVVTRMPRDVEQHEHVVRPSEDWREVTYTRDGTIESVIDAIDAAAVLLGDGSVTGLTAPSSASH